MNSPVTNVVDERCTPDGLVVGEALCGVFISDQEGNVIDVNIQDVDFLIRALQAGKAQWEAS